MLEFIHITIQYTQQHICFSQKLLDFPDKMMVVIFCFSSSMFDQVTIDLINIKIETDGKHVIPMLHQLLPN